MKLLTLLSNCRGSVDPAKRKSFLFWNKGFPAACWQSLTAVFLMMAWGLSPTASAQTCASGQEFFTISHLNTPVSSSGTIGYGILPDGNAVTVTENETGGAIGVTADASGADGTLNGCFVNTTNNITDGGVLTLSTGDNDAAEYTYTFCNPITDPYIFVGPSGIEVGTTVTVKDGGGSDIPITLIDGETGFGTTGSEINATSNNVSGYVRINDGVARTVIVLVVENAPPNGADGFDIAIGVCMSSTTTPALGTYACPAGATEERIDFDALGLLSTTLQTNGGSQTNLNTGYKDENGNDIVFSSISTSGPNLCSAAFSSNSDVNSTIPSIDQEAPNGPNTGNTITYEFANPTKFRIESGGADMDAGEFVVIKTFDGSNSPVNVTAKLSSYPSNPNVYLNRQAAQDIAASEIEIIALANSAVNWTIEAVNPVKKVEITIVTYSSANGNDIVEYDFFVCDNPPTSPSAPPILCTTGQKFYTTSHFTATSAAFPTGSGVAMTETNVVEDPVISYNENNADNNLNQCFVNTSNFIDGGGYIRVLAEGGDAVDFTYNFCEAVTNPFIFIGNDGIEAETTIEVLEADGTTPIPIFLNDGDPQFKVTAPNIIGSDELEGGESGYVQIQDNVARTTIVLRVVRAANQGDLDGWNMGIGACSTPITTPPLGAYACPSGATEERIDFDAIGLLSATLQTNGGSQTNLATGYFDDNGNPINFASIATSGPAHCTATFASASDVNSNIPSIDQETGGGANTGNTITYEFANPTQFRIESGGADMDAGEFVRIRTFDASNTPVPVTAKLSSYPTAENVLLNGQATMDISGSEVEIFALANTAQNWEIQAVNPVTKVEITIVTYSDAAGNDIVEYDFFVCNSPVPPVPPILCASGQNFFTTSHFTSTTATFADGNSIAMTEQDIVEDPQITYNENNADNNLSSCFVNTSNFIDEGGYIRVIAEGNDAVSFKYDFCEAITNPFIFVGNDGIEAETTIEVLEADGVTPIPIGLIDGHAQFKVLAPNVIGSDEAEGGESGYVQIQDNVARNSIVLRVIRAANQGDLDGWNMGIGACSDPTTTPAVPYACPSGTTEERINFSTLNPLLQNATLQTNGGSQTNLATPFKDVNNDPIVFASISTSAPTHCPITFASASDANNTIPSIDQETGGGAGTGNKITYEFTNPVQLRIVSDGADMDVGEYVRIEAFDASNAPVALNGILSNYSQSNVLMNGQAAMDISASVIEVFSFANTAVNWEVQAPTPVKRVEITIVANSGNASADIVEYDMFVCTIPCSANIPTCGSGTEARGVTTSWTAHTSNAANGNLGSTSMALSSTGGLQVRRHYGNGASLSFNGCDPDQSLEPATGGSLMMRIPSGSQNGTVTITPNATVTDPVVYIGRLQANTTIDFVNSTSCIQLLKQRGGLQVVGSTQVQDNGGFQGYGIVQLIGTFDNANPVLMDYTSSGSADAFRFAIGELQCLSPGAVEACGPVLEGVTCSGAQSPTVRVAGWTKTSNTGANGTMILNGDNININAAVTGTGLRIVRAATNRPYTFRNPNCYAPNAREGGWMYLRQTTAGSGVLTINFPEPVSNPLVYIRNLVNRDLDFSGTTDVDGNAACCLALVSGCQGLAVNGALVSDTGGSGQADGVIQVLGEFTSLNIQMGGSGPEVVLLSVADPDDEECADEPTCQATVDLAECGPGELRSTTTSWTSKAGNSQADGTYASDENGSVNVTSTTTGNVTISSVRAGGASSVYRNSSIYGVRPANGPNGYLCYRSPANGSGQIKITFAESVTDPLIYVGRNGLLWTKLDFGPTVQDDGSPVSCMAEISQNGSMIYNGFSLEDNGSYAQGQGLYQLQGDYSEIIIDVSKTQSKREYFCLTVGEVQDDCDPTPPPCGPDVASCNPGELRSVTANYISHTSTSANGVYDSEEYGTAFSANVASSDGTNLPIVGHRYSRAASVFRNMNVFDARPKAGGYLMVENRRNGAGNSGMLTFTFAEAVANPVIHLRGIGRTSLDFAPTLDEDGVPVECVALLTGNAQAQVSGTAFQDAIPGGWQASGTVQLIGSFTEIKISVDKVAGSQNDRFYVAVGEACEDCDPTPPVCEPAIAECPVNMNGADAASFSSHSSNSATGTFPDYDNGSVSLTGSINNANAVFNESTSQSALCSFPGTSCITPATGGYVNIEANGNVGSTVTWTFGEPVIDPIFYVEGLNSYELDFGSSVQQNGSPIGCLAKICGNGNFGVNSTTIADANPGGFPEAGGAVQLIGTYSTVIMEIRFNSGATPDDFRVTFGEQKTECSTVPSPMNVSADITPVDCFGASTGVINVSVLYGLPPYSFDWDDLPGSNDPEDRSNLPAGLYTVVVMDANGCTASQTFNVTQSTSALQVAGNVTDVLCFGGNDGAINITASGGMAPYNYDWADMAGTNNSEDRTSLSAGTYTVTVTDNKGCEVVNDYDVNEPSAALTCTSVVAAACDGGNNGAIDVTASGGTPGYTYDWADIPGNVNAEDRNNLSAGTYNLTVTDANGCTTSKSVVVGSSPAISLDAVATPTSCPGETDGEIALTASGGTPPFTFDWADIPGANDVEDRSGLAEGTYYVTATDANGCTSATSATINSGDNTPPMANCQDITIDLDNAGNASVNASQIDNGSSDNCGAVTLSLSETNFNCEDVGDVNVVLTVTDGSGLTSTCPAIITINPFVTITNAMVGDESCGGASDGSIIVEATAPAGQIFYSIDGGVTLTPTGVFENLAPDVYTVLVQVQKTALCTAEGTFTVNPGPTPTIWYSDADDDGFSNGQTISSCVRPSGYKTAAELNGQTSGDCDDNDPVAFPNQTWYSDQDDDGYGDASGSGPVTGCDRPAGYKAASELPGGVDNDCDDSNAAVNPGATEVCNGIDDDCDGQIDEGVSGNQTFVGNVYLFSQADVDAFSQCYNKIQGDLYISGLSINNLGPLSNLEEVTGNVTIQYTTATSLGGLDALHTIGLSLKIFYNTQLNSLNGLGALTSVGSLFQLYYNFTLEDCCAVAALLDNGGVGGAVIIFFNQPGSHCNSQAAIIADCNPTPNPFNGGNNDSATGTTKDLGAVYLFPNPAISSVTVALDGIFEKGEIQVTDYTGRIVYVQHIEKNTAKFELDITGWTAGLYLVQTAIDGEIYVEKLMVK